MTDFLSIYTDVFGSDLLRYILGAGGTYLVINVLLSRRIAGQRIRPQRPHFKQMRREILASLRTVAVFAASGTCIVLGARAGFLTIYQDFSAYGWAYFWISVTVLIVAHDAWFYWSHRALHYPPLFKRFHRLHHRSHNPTPFTAYSFDVGEAVVNAVYLPLVLLILPAHPLALFIFVTHMILRNAVGHCGYEIFPAKRDGSPLVGWLTSVTHHDLHHAHAGYNMGLYFAWWDRWMGTEHPDYLDAFAQSAPQFRIPKNLVVGSIAALAVGLLASQSRANTLEGRYASPGIGVIVEFLPCDAQNLTVCGRLIWAWDAASTAHAKPGDTILRDLTYDGSVWKGTLKDPETGRTYRGTLAKISAHQLALRGCAGPLCANQVWYETAYLRSVLAR